MLIVGCGGAGTSIHGTVTLDDAPLEHGAIQFVPVSMTTGTITGATITEGRYLAKTAKGAPAEGMYTVKVTAMRATGKKASPPGFPDRQVDVQVEAVAPQYNNKSTLQCEIKPGDNALDFKVYSK